MSNLLALGKMLHTLQMPFQQDNEYTRVVCPLQHSKSSLRASGSFHMKTGRYYCFACKQGAKSLEDFLFSLELDTRLQMKKNPSLAHSNKMKLHLILEAQEALKATQATTIPATA